jgi:nitrogen fixation NifU-like protein
MPTFELTPEMMREIIMDHYSNPAHKGVPEDPSGYKKIHTSAVNCIDDFDVYLKEKGGVIEDAKWEGTACTISSASTDILCEQAIGKNADEAEYMIAQYMNMIEEKPYDSSVLEEALAFANTGKQAARIHCATMGWTALKELLDEEKGKHGED